MSRFSLEREGPKVKVTVATDLTAETVPELRELLCAIQEDGVTDLTLDLSGTQVLDATGISLLVATANSYRGAHQTPDSAVGSTEHLLLVADLADCPAVGRTGGVTTRWPPWMMTF